MSSEQIVMADIDEDQVWHRVTVPVGERIWNQVNVSAAKQADSVLDNALTLRWVIEDQAIEDSDG
jgi:hypothetical protein